MFRWLLLILPLLSQPVFAAEFGVGVIDCSMHIKVAFCEKGIAEHVYVKADVFRRGPFAVSVQAHHISHLEKADFSNKKGTGQIDWFGVYLLYRW